VESEAVDAKGIIKIELYVDGKLYRSDASASVNGESPFRVQQPWRATVLGRHNLSVRAYSVTGQISMPASVLVEVVEIAEAQPTPTPVAPVGEPSVTPAIPPTATPPAKPPVPTSPPSAELTPTPPCTDGSAFVADVTVPDHSVFAPGQSFDKVWRMRNSGSCAWTPEYRWVFQSGAQMGAPDSVPVPQTSPGASADISVPMVAPETPGDYVGRWIMTNPAGQPFGSWATCVITVKPAGDQAPIPPGRLSAAAQSASSIALQWDPPRPEDKVLGFRVYRADNRSLVASLDNPSAQGYVVNGLACNTEYSFYVTAYNAAGESPPSNVATTRTSSCQPALPVIHYFKAEPAIISPGQNSLLSWDLSGAREAYLDGEGVVAPGSRTVSPITTTVYTLQAINDAGTVTKQVTVTVATGGQQPPQVRIQVKPPAVGDYGRFVVTVEGRDDKGLEAIWWWAENSGDPELDKMHTWSCKGTATCSYTWESRTRKIGMLRLVANARDVDGHQAEEGPGLAETTIKVVAVHASGQGILVKSPWGFDLDSGQVMEASNQAADFQWQQVTEIERYLKPLHGATLAVLGSRPSLYDVGFYEVQTAPLSNASINGSNNADNQIPAGTVLAARTSDGRHAKFRIDSYGSITISFVTYAE